LLKEAGEGDTTMAAFLGAAVTVPVQDMERARAFYEQMLGLKPVSVTPGGVLYAVGNAQLLLYPSQFAGRAGHTLARMAVADLHAAVRDLRERGVLFDDLDLPDAGETNPRAATACFRDSEGNLISIGEAS
jgi:catechol 2,3-dioxygenase-like lactoylglutathione lyase family enzyme